MQYYKPKQPAITSISPRNKAGRAELLAKGKVIGYNLYNTAMSVVVKPKPVYVAFEMQSI